MFTTYTQVNFFALGAACFCNSVFDQQTNTQLINGCKWICDINTACTIFVQDFASIVTWHTQCCLCQIVCSEFKEFTRFRDFICQQCGTWQFNHWTNFVFNAVACFCEQCRCCCIDNRFNDINFFLGSNQWNFDFWEYANTCFLAFYCSR